MTFGWRGSCWTWKWFDLMGLIDDTVLLRFFYIIFVRSVLTFLEVVSVSSTFQVFQWDLLQSRAKTCGQSSSWNTHLKRLVKKFRLQIKQPMVDIKDYLLKSLIPWSKSRLLRTTSTKLNRIPYLFSCQTSSCLPAGMCSCQVPRGWTSMQKFTVSMSNKRFYRFLDEYFPMLKTQKAVLRKWFLGWVLASQWHWRILGGSKV